MTTGEITKQTAAVQIFSIWANATEQNGLYKGKFTSEKLISLFETALTQDNPVVNLSQKLSKKPTVQLQAKEKASQILAQVFSSQTTRISERSQQLTQQAASGTIWFGSDFNAAANILHPDHKMTVRIGGVKYTSIRDAFDRLSTDPTDVEQMRTILQAKFVQGGLPPNTALKTTGTAKLVFHNTGPFWSEGPDGQGQNWYGRLLMEIRG
jgi:predicted NAD-dependent protein-ADP-ribosyltransferase YbiA (DUF1768 family)